MSVATMAGHSGHKRVLGDTTNAHRNITLSPKSAKKRKLDSFSSPLNRMKSSQAGPGGKLGSSQPKSHFEEEVLEKLTQDIYGLKQNNSERDQHWARPSLDDFHEGKDALCFQQIEAEEGTLHGGKTTVKLFGVTEVSRHPMDMAWLSTDTLGVDRLVIPFFSMSPTFFIISMSPLLYPLPRTTVKASSSTWRPNWLNTNQPFNPCR